MTVSELPWYYPGLVFPLVVGITLAVVTGLCLIIRTAALSIIAGVQAGQAAFLEDMKAERERSREERALERKDRSEERGQFIKAIDAFKDELREAIDAFKDELREHTTVSMQMYHTMERVDNKMDHLHRGLGVPDEMDERAHS